MKLTKSQLKQLIKEELQVIQEEETGGPMLEFKRQQQAHETSLTAIGEFLYTALPVRYQSGDLDDALTLVGDYIRKVGPYMQHQATFGRNPGEQALAQASVPTDT